MATWGALYAAGLLSYSRFDNWTTRTIAGIGPTETATGSFASDLLGARLEIGRTYALPGVNITPFAALQGSTLWERGFTESSTTGGLPGILGLTYQSQTVTSLPTFLGVQFDTRWARANGTVWSPFVRAAWVHEFSPDRSITCRCRVRCSRLTALAPGATPQRSMPARGLRSIDTPRCSPASTASSPAAATATAGVAG